MVEYDSTSTRIDRSGCIQSHGVVVVFRAKYTVKENQWREWTSSCFPHLEKNRFDDSLSLCVSVCMRACVRACVYKTLMARQGGSGRHMPPDPYNRTCHRVFTSQPTLPPSLPSSPGLLSITFRHQTRMLKGNASEVEDASRPENTKKKGRDLIIPSMFMEVLLWWA